MSPLYSMAFYSSVVRGRPSKSISPATREESPFFRTSGVVSFFASFLSAFTISLVGEMPVGELIYIAVAGWSILCMVIRRTWPGPLMESNLFLLLVAAQVLSFAAYIASDLYCGSSSHDMARGWARMVLLGIEVVSFAYLFGQSRHNFLIFVCGFAVGSLVHVFMYGALYGEMWKFGFGYPVSFCLMYFAPMLGLRAAVAITMAFGAVNFWADFRSMGVICIMTACIAALHLLPRTPRGLRVWFAPLGFLIAIGMIVFIYSRTMKVERASRSDVERQAMVQAAVEAFKSSPLIGKGSWFSNTDVYDNFMLIRYDDAQLSGVGGFAGANSDPENTTLHTQILVALAEGGIFGGTFFIIYGFMILWALYNIVFVAPPASLNFFYIFYLVQALWALLFSPFSGSARVEIAAACGLILIIWQRAQVQRSSSNNLGMV